MAAVAAVAARAAVAAARRAVRASAALCVALAATAGCGLLPPPDLKPPTVTLSDLSVTEVNLQRVRMSVRLAAHNPNSIDIPLTDIRFELSLFGQPFARGTVPEQRVTLPALASREVPVEFVVAASDLGALLRRLSAGPWPDGVWELKGSARWGASPLPIAFEKRGDSGSLRRLKELLGR
jgi:LEA14-like dessication related protein